MTSLSDRFQRMSLSASAVVKQCTNDLKRTGAGTLDFTTGGPGFDTPAHIKQAAYKTTAGGETKYTSTPDVPALREMV